MKESLVEEPLYIALQEVLENIDYQLVDVRHGNHGPSTNVYVVIKNREGATTIDDCAEVHRLIAPRLTLFFAKRDIQLEVSTPGIGRNIKDAHEFGLFLGEGCRIYDHQEKVWLYGVIAESSNGQLVLENVRAEGSKEVIERYTIPYERIHKAKLAHAWEERP